MRNAEPSLAQSAVPGAAQSALSASRRKRVGRGGAEGKSKSAEASRGRVGVKDRNTGGNKAPHPPEALVFTAP